jgi:hypothetical protein
MTDVELQTKCKQLLVRRDQVTSPWDYIRRDWRRQLLFFIAYVAVSATLWLLDFHILSAVFAGIFLGRVIRDIRWWNVLSKEWPTTCELLDWPRIQEIASN